MINNMEDVNNILDAVQNVANFSILEYQFNDSLLGEITRILNIYSKDIGESNDERAKEVYNKATSILKSGQRIDKQIVKLKNSIQDLLEFMSQR